MDLNNKLITIPPERFKSGAAHTLPLSDAAASLLEELPRFERLVFTSNLGKKHINGWSNAKKIDRRMLRTLRALARRRGDDPSKVRCQAGSSTTSGTLYARAWLTSARRRMSPRWSSGMARREWAAFQPASLRARDARSAAEVGEPVTAGGEHPDENVVRLRA